MKARRISPGSSCDATASRRVHASASLVAPSTLTDDAYARSVPSSANPMPTEPRMSDFQAASMAAGVRDEAHEQRGHDGGGLDGHPYQAQVVQQGHGQQGAHEPQQQRPVPTPVLGHAASRPALAWRRNAGEPARAMRPTSVTTSSVQPPRASTRDDPAERR